DFLGRIDDQVKVRGVRVELGEIEVAVAGHSQVKAVAMVGLDDGNGEKIIVAYVVPHNERLLTAGELGAMLRRKLPTYMLPSRFVFLDSLPLTPNGKVDRKALASTQQLPLPQPRLGALPKDDVEARTLRVWEE